MVEYDDFKNLIIWNDPVLGEIDLDYIVTAMQDLIKKQSEFEKIIYQIIKTTSNYDNSDISSLFDLSTTKTMQMYIDMITDKL